MKLYIWNLQDKCTNKEIKIIPNKKVYLDLLETDQSKSKWIIDIRKNNQ